jgi:hypothetical protein
VSEPSTPRLSRLKNRGEQIIERCRKKRKSANDVLLRAQGYNRIETSGAAGREIDRQRSHNRQQDGGSSEDQRVVRVDFE